MHPDMLAKRPVALAICFEQALLGLLVGAQWFQMDEITNVSVI